MKLFINFYLFALFCAFSEATLSKSDRNKKKTNEEVQLPKKTKISIPKNLNEDLKSLADITNFDLEIEKNSILDEHNTLDVTERNFDAGITLAYVTPWNNHGYDIVKWAARKFTHIAPVWFQLRSGTIDGELTCSFGGTHDIDRGWIDDIISNNSEVKIVPRFLFEGWTSDELKQFLTDEATNIRCGQAIVEFLQRNQMHGGVMEIWLQIMTMTRGTGAEYLIEIIENWSAEFRNADLTFILPLTPPLNKDLEEIGIIPIAMIKRIFDSVDYVNLMTYDYASPEIAGVAPISWVEANMVYFLKAGGATANPSKLLVGLNWYGYDRTSGTNNAILGNKFVELLNDPSSTLEFDENAAEYFVRYGSDGIAYFPTAKSIKMRLKLAKKYAFGIAIWEIGQGLDYFTSIL